MGVFYAILYWERILALEPLAVCIYSHKSGLQETLEAQLAAQGIEYLPVVEPSFSWKSRALRTLEVAKAHPDRLLLFLDAWDTIMLGTKAELMNLGLERGITFAASRLCWPDEKRYVDYNNRQAFQLMSPWRYLNSNPMTGLGSSIASAMEYGWQRWPIVGDSADTRVADGDVCERFYTHLYLDTDFDISLDTECRVSQIFLCSTPGDLAVANRRIYNTRTHSWPIFLHANGGVSVNMEWFR